VKPPEEWRRLVAVAAFGWATDRRHSISERHPRRGGGPHQVHFLRREAVGLVDEVAELAFEVKGLGGEGAGVLGAEGGEAGGA